MPDPQAPALDERARGALRRLEWHLGGRRVRSALPGEHRSIFRGRGMEFDQVVRFEFGDDIRDVDWNVTARLGEVHRKVFVEDREIELVVVFADEPALQFGSGARTRRAVLQEAAALLMLLGVLTRARVTLMHQRADGVRVHPATRRRDRIMAALATLLADPGPDPLGAPLGATPLIEGRLTAGSLLLWLGDVPAGPPPRAWGGFRRPHQVIGIRAEDPWERDPPALGGATAFDPVAGTVLSLSDGPGTREAHRRWRGERERLWQAWWPDPTDRLVIDTAGDPLQVVSRFVRERHAVSGRRR